jgi:hypothetical protein
MGGMPQLPKQQTVERTPYQSELDYFKANPTVAGMATEDNRVIINPYSNLTKDEKNSVFQNEKARIIMRTDEKAKPKFLLTWAVNQRQLWNDPPNDPQRCAGAYCAWC